MKQSVLYVLRLVATIVLSCLIGFGLNYLVKFIFFSIMTLIPALLHTIFYSYFSDIARETNIETGSILGFVTGVGHGVAVVEGKELSVRLAMVIATFITIIETCIVGYVSYKLVQIINGRKVLSLITAFFFLFWMLSLIIDFYVTDYMTYPGVVDKNFWYYGLSGILLLIVLFAMISITVSGWIKHDFEK